MLLRVLASVVVLATTTCAQADPALDHAKEVLAKSILMDGHNDLPWAIRGYKDAPGDVAAYDIRQHAPGKGQTDIPRLRAGGVGAVFWSVYTPGETTEHLARTQLEQIDIARRMIERYPDTFTLASTAADVRAAKAAGKIAGMLGAEGGHSIEDSLGALRAYYDLGVRYMTLTHNNHTDWADSAMDPNPGHGGLTEFGEKVVHEMNRIGMLVDLSHTAPDTMRDAIRVSQAPVIFSHSSARALCEIPRNVPDDVLALLPANGGVVMVNFYTGYLSEPFRQWSATRAGEEARVKALFTGQPDKRDAAMKEWDAAHPSPKADIGIIADHIDHIAKVAGHDHVGLGGDLDGIPYDLSPPGMNSVSAPLP